MTTTTAQRTVVYNMGPDNPHPMKDLWAFADAGIPRIYLCETQGKRLEPIAGYHLLRDRSTEGRANVSAYVAVSENLDAWRYVDVKGSWWMRRQHKGRHPGRAFLVIWTVAEDGYPEQDVVVHLPPAGRDTARATALTWAAIIRVAAPWRRMVNPARRRRAHGVRRRILGDLNGSPSSPAVKRARRLCRMTQVGHRIDAALTRNWTRTTAAYDTIVPRVDPGGRILRRDNGHRLGTDHPWGALYLRMFR